MIAKRLFGPLIEDSTQAYSRERDLPLILAVWPREIEDYSLGGTLAIVDHLKKVLNAMRVSAIGGHWSYDVNRHMALMAALRAEQKRLAHLRNCSGLAHIVQQAAE